MANLAQGNRLEEALAMLEQLPAAAKIQAIERLAGMLDREITAFTQPPAEPVPLKTFYGLWGDLKVDISEDDFAEIRREMWADFANRDA